MGYAGPSKGKLRPSCKHFVMKCCSACKKARLADRQLINYVRKRSDYRTDIPW